MRTSAGVLFDVRGQVRQISGVTQDVSERHELEKQLRESQKMEALGRLAGGVAHDFNNLMTIVSGYAQLLEVSAWDEELLVEGVEAIKNAAEKAAGLTAQLLAFSRRSRAEPKVADLNQLVSRALKLLERLIRETVVVRVELERNECPVKIDLTHFQQIMMNLVVNANDAMPDGGELLVKVRTLDIASKELPDRHNLPPGPYVEMHVRDTGGGIHPELLPNIFEPFFTTKSVGQGTGLGLAVVHGVVKQWDGHIEVESSTNAGTSFRILFPRSSERVAAAPRGLVDRSVGSGETILVVEDEDAVRKLTCLSLERKGYKVLQAPLATTAIEIAEREHFDLLLTDVIMPGMDGQKLAEVLRERRECLPIIFMSGYTGDALVQAESEDAPQSFLQKPFTQRELLTLVRGLLDGKQTSDS